MIGVPEADLAWFLEHPCPPDVVGVNTYLSSERFLDERVDRYPTEAPGTNGKHSYVDVLAARVLPEGAAGPGALLREAWDRYGLPLDVTEAHNGCTREEQLRWLDEVWRGAEGARAAGADVRAVTVWSLLGAYDWHSLVTRDEGVYEPRVFDLRAPAPRPTALAPMMRDLATGRRHAHPVLAVPGWWRRPDRFIYGHVVVGDALVPVAEPDDLAAYPAAPVLIVGATDPLPPALTRACRARGIPYRLVDRRSVRLVDPSAVAALLRDHAPWAVIETWGAEHVAGAACEANGRCREVAEGAAVLAAACAARGVRLLAFSSDLVFDGATGEPYVESAPVAPLGACGRRQAEAETRVLQTHPPALLVRTGPLFGREDGHDPLAAALRPLAAGVPFLAPEDAAVSPTSAPDVADAALDLLVDGERGIWHLANRGAVAWADLIRRAAALSGIPPGGPLRSAGPSDVGGPRRPSRVLVSERGWVLSDLEDALARHLRDLDSVPEASGKTIPVAAEVLSFDGNQARSDPVITPPDQGVGLDVLVAYGPAPGASAPTDRLVETPAPRPAPDDVPRPGPRNRTESIRDPWAAPADAVVADG